MRTTNWKFALALTSAVLSASTASSAWADDDTQVAPSTANGCGRLKMVAPLSVPTTRYRAPYPQDARQRNQKGHVLLRVLVDKYGFARNPEVVISSGYAQLDQASIDSVKDRWRWELPPPECQESGVVAGVTFDWNLVRKAGDIPPEMVYLDDAFYPAKARERKLGGEGKVEYTISGDNKVTDARVTASTGSPDLDAAMLAKIRTIRFPYGTTSTNFTASQPFEFVPHDDPDTFKALMGPAIIPNPADLPGTPPRFRYVYPWPAPSLANGCGRDRPVYLEPSPTNSGLAYPVEGAGKEGRTVIDVLIDKSGTASDVTVTGSSGSQVLDQVVVKGIKGLWHYQAPPLECADSGVHMHIPVDTFYGEARTRIMAGDPTYPAEAVAAKLSGSGVVYIARRADGDLFDARVVTSTNSPVLDAAMIKLATELRFTPGTKEQHLPLGGTYAIEFVGDPDAMRAAAAAPVRRIAPPAPPPSAANECGRTGDVYLAPVDSSHRTVPIPMVEVEHARQIPGFSRPFEIPARSFRAQGALEMRVLVDKDGKAASVTVAQSSAPPAMERVVTGTVKENYRWAPPPPECAEKGVMLNVNYIYTSAPEKLQIYADDPVYPDAARARSMGAAGVVNIRYHGDKIDDAKVVVSTGSPELDAAMIKVASDRLLADMQADPKPEPAIVDLPLMFMPAFVASPKPQAARTQQNAAATSPPTAPP